MSELIKYKEQELKPEFENGLNVLKGIQSVILHFVNNPIPATDYNAHFKYHYRGIKSVVNALGAVEANNNLVSYPRYRGELSDKGMYCGITTWVVQSVIDGSWIFADIIAQGGDSSGDKGGLKAMSASLKYFAAQVYKIPFDDLEDSDKDYHDNSAGKKGDNKKPSLPPPAKVETYYYDLSQVKSETAESMIAKRKSEGVFDHETFVLSTHTKFPEKFDTLLLSADESAARVEKYKTDKEQAQDDELPGFTLQEGKVGKGIAAVVDYIEEQKSKDRRSLEG